MSKYISLLEEVAKLKTKLKEEGYTFYPHTLFGTEVDNENFPTGVITSFEAKGYLGLGMLENLLLLINQAKNKTQSAYLSIVSPTPDSELSPEVLKRAADAAINDYLKDRTNDLDPDIYQVIDKYKEQITEAIINRDQNALNKIQDLISEDLKKIKGPDFEGKFIIGAGNLMSKKDDFDDNNPSDLFDPKNIKRFF